MIAMRLAGIKVLPGIVNACVFTSALSAGNSFLFAGSRILYGLALRGQAPRYLTYCTKKGMPMAAVLTLCAFALLSFMNVSEGAATVFKCVVSHHATYYFLMLLRSWLVNLSTVAGFFGWWSINLTYIFFCNFFLPVYTMAFTMLTTPFTHRPRPEGAGNRPQWYCLPQLTAAIPSLLGRVLEHDVYPC